MKNISIKKSRNFSDSSKIYVFVGSRKVHIKGFGLYTLPINEGEFISASQLWTGSNRIYYDNVDDGILLIIKPRLNRILAIIVGIVFLVCTIISIFTKCRWSFLPLVPFIIYITIYLTVLRNRYLIIEKDPSEIK